MTMRTLVPMACLVLVSGLFCPSAGARDGKVYNHLVITTFETPAGTELSPDFAQELRRNLTIQLSKTNRFKEITVVDGNGAKPPNADMELCGKITRFKKGSRAKRYWTLPGIGATSIKAIVEFKELPAGTTLYKSEVDGKVVMGAYGGDSLGATKGLAKDVVKIVKKHLP